MAMYDQVDLLLQHGIADISKLKCSLPNGYNPSIEALEEDLMANLRLYFPANAVQKLKSYNFAQLIGRTYCQASLERGSLIYYIIVWIWIVDDMFDRTSLGKDKEKAEGFRQFVMKLVRNEETSVEGEFLNFIKFTKSIFQKFRDQTSPFLFHRFAFYYQQYLESMDWEVEHRVNQTFPEVNTYNSMRRYTGAIFPAYVLNEFAIETDVPLVIHEHETIQRLENLTADMICWANDVFSLRNELKQGEVQNLVILLYLNEKGMSLQEALDEAIRAHNEHENEVLRIMEDLPDFGSKTLNKIAADYIDTLVKWVRGNHEWSLVCGRYNVRQKPAGGS